ncbi:MAG: hypothetical protein R3F50_04175 [Gammaproteobacteria bacterium]
MKPRDHEGNNHEAGRHEKAHEQIEIEIEIEIEPGIRQAMNQTTSQPNSQAAKLYQDSPDTGDPASSSGRRLKPLQLTT